VAIAASGQPRTIVEAGNGTNSVSYVLPPGVVLDLEAVYAEIDATAAGDTTAELTISDQTGVVIARKRQGETITGGAPGSATWALRLADDGGGSGGYNELQQNSVPVTHRHKLDFLSSDVILVDSPPDKTLAFVNGASGAIRRVRDENINLNFQPAINFTGPGVTATENAPFGAIDVTIPGVLGTLVPQHPVYAVAHMDPAHVQAGTGLGGAFWPLILDSTTDPAITLIASGGNPNRLIRIGSAALAGLYIVTIHGQITTQFGTGNSSGLASLANPLTGAFGQYDAWRNLDGNTPPLFPFTWNQSILVDMVNGSTVGSSILLAGGGLGGTVLQAGYITLARILAYSLV
jgi:hypothetical protein